MAVEGSVTCRRFIPRSRHLHRAVERVCVELRMDRRVRNVGAECIRGPWRAGVWNGMAES